MATDDHLSEVVKSSILSLNFYVFCYKEIWYIFRQDFVYML